MDFLTPFEFRKSGKSMKNRLCLAPMTNTQSQDDGSLGDDELRWLERRAEGGFAMVMTCASHVSPGGQGWQDELGIFGDHLIPGLHRLAKNIKKHGALAIVQIFHGGCRAPSRLTGSRPVSASEFDLDVKDFERPRALATEEIYDLVEDFAAAAGRAVKAGFDGIEIHGAHGYLITQFLSTQTNLRHDDWGGCLENRARFLLDIVSEVQSRVPRDFLVGVRISPENFGAQKGLDFDEMLRVSQWLAQKEIDFLDVSIWDMFKEPDQYKGSGKTVLERYRDALPRELPLMAAGGCWTPADASRAMDLGADLISIGRAAIGHPDWPQQAHNPTYLPKRPPFTREELKKAGLGQKFIEYMSRWQGFVT